MSLIDFKMNCYARRNICQGGTEELRKLGEGVIKMPLAKNKSKPQGLGMRIRERLNSKRIRLHSTNNCQAPSYQNRARKVAVF